jgi:hypothetical protein
MKKLLEFIDKYCNRTYFLERNMCLISRPDLQEKKHLAGYCGWLGGEFSYFVRPDVLHKVFTSEEITTMLDTGLIELTRYDIFDRLRNVELYEICPPTESKGNEVTVANQLTNSLN